MQGTEGLTADGKTVKPEEVRLLEKPGDENRKVETIIDYIDHDNFSEPIPIETGEEKKCALCGINKMPYEKSELILKQTEDFYLVDTEDRKGHVIRNMGVTKDHGVFPAVEESVEMIDELVDSTASQTLHEYENGELEEPDLILYGSMDSFSEDFHLVASDLYGGNPEDLESIQSYLRFEFDEEDGYRIDTEKSHLRDSFGEYMEKWMEETERFGPE